jgi:MoxR-like ATPase
VNVALNLGLPLLVTGDPGTGKSVLARAVAYELGYAFIEFVAKSTTTATDMLYRFDAVRQFRDAQIEAIGRKAETTSGATPAPTRKFSPKELAPYVRFEGLGKAIALTYPAGHSTIAEIWDEEANRTTSDDQAADTDNAPAMPNTEGIRSVVLIDELDKAPRDVPNDLLIEIDRGTFRITEAGVRLSVQKERTPVVFVTSNSEKSLPDAFLRRCVFHHIEFPDDNELKLILASRLPRLTEDGPTPQQLEAEPASNKSGAPTPRLKPLALSGLGLFRLLRPEPDDDRPPLRKPPSTAELLSWLHLLLDIGITPETDLRAIVPDRVAGGLLTSTLSVLVKDRNDRQRVRDDRVLENWAKTA